jgi:hypothetical protein
MAKHNMGIPLDQVYHTKHIGACVDDELAKDQFE